MNLTNMEDKEKISYLLHTTEESGYIKRVPKETVLNNFTDPIKLKEFLIANDKIDFEYFSIFMVNKFHLVINIYDSDTKEFRNLNNPHFNQNVPIELQPIRKEGDLIRWFHQGILKGRVYEAPIALVNMEEQCYYVYVDYGGGQDMIPFNKILPDA